MMLVISLVLACGMILALLKGNREYRRLPQLPISTEGDLRDLTVIIPARNEAKTIAQAVKSFAPRVPVIVVDDDSSDKTGEVARAAGAEVIPAPPLRKRIAGKANACAAGAKASDSTWILFVDADTRYRQEFLPSLMAEARKNSL